jgi:predicted aspartyl protease
VEGALHTITGTQSQTVLVSNTRNYGETKLRQKYPPPEPLDTVTIGIQFMNIEAKKFNMDILPDTGANVTAIDASQAQGIPLERTSVVLKVANGTILDTLGTAEAEITRHGNAETELVYIVNNLSEPLLSRRMLKALNMLHPDWPHQDCSRAKTNAVSE